MNLEYFLGEKVNFGRLVKGFSFYLKGKSLIFGPKGVKILVSFVVLDS